MNLRSLMGIVAKTMSGRRLAIMAAAALGLYSFGDEGYSYMSTATRLVSQEVESQIPLSFEIERARTMITKLAPDIKRHMLVIAQEEVGVESLHKEIKATEASLKQQREALLELRKRSDAETTASTENEFSSSMENLNRDLERRFNRFRIGEATLAAKKDLLVSREESLDAARAKLSAMLNAKRDLEVQTENLEARVRNLHSEAMTNRVDFADSDSDVSRCQSLVNSLKARLDVSEKLIVAEAYDPIDAMPLANVNVKEDIDRYFALKTK